MEVTLMQSFLKTDFLGRNCFVLNSVNSTNTYIKERWRLLDHGHTVIAKEQLSGRGRKGKSFYSPKATDCISAFFSKNPALQTIRSSRLS